MNCGIEKNIVSLLFCLHEGEGEKGVFAINYETRKKLYPYSAGLVKARGKRGS